MSLSADSYSERARRADYLVYRIAEADREGNIRTEEANPANPMQNCYSVAKAFTVLALGICVDRGLLSPETRLCELFLDEMKEAVTRDPRWGSVNLHHCMTHKIGYETGCLDVDTEDASAWPSRDYLSLAFSHPLTCPAGERRVYSDAAFYILSRVVSKVTGETLLDFIRPVLMNRMRFRDLAWSTCPAGYTLGATGLFLHVSDMVKLGVLWLRGGDWFGDRIVSREWTERVITCGYDCYRLSDLDGGWYGKGGMNGQMVAFNPSLGRAVAWQAYRKNLSFNRLIGDPSDFSEQ